MEVPQTVCHEFSCDIRIIGCFQTLVKTTAIKRQCCKYWCSNFRDEETNCKDKDLFGVIVLIQKQHQFCSNLPSLKNTQLCCCEQSQPLVLLFETVGNVLLNWCRNRLRDRQRWFTPSAHASKSQVGNTPVLSLQRDLNHFLHLRCARSYLHLILVHTLAPLEEPLRL